MMGSQALMCHHCQQHCRSAHHLKNVNIITYLHELTSAMDFQVKINLEDIV